MTDFAALLDLLNSREVRFIVIGGAAAIAHGAARLTQDLDLVYDRDANNIHNLAAALSEVRPYLRGAPPNLPFLFDAETLRRGLNFTLATSIGDIDLLAEIPGGGTYQDLLPFTDTLLPFDRPCVCLRLDKLIEVKRAAGRPKDFDAIAELEALWDERE